jgi:hypothetical protein
VSRRCDNDAVEDVAEMSDKSIFDVAPLELLAQKTFERGDAAVGDPARHYQVEVERGRC